MHEHSLMIHLMRQIEEVAAREGATAVRGVKVRLGALSHFTEEHFREHFDVEAKGGVAQHARLDIESSADIYAPGAQDVILEAVEIS